MGEQFGVVNTIDVHLFRSDLDLHLTQLDLFILIRSKSRLQFDRLDGHLDGSLRLLDRSVRVRGLLWTIVQKRFVSMF